VRAAGGKRVPGGDRLEGGGQELHRPAGAGGVLARGHAGKGGAAVVGFDLADRGEHRPVQPGTVLGRSLIQHQYLRRDVLLGFWAWGRAGAGRGWWGRGGQ